jgi:hypothetical protein
LRVPGIARFRLNGGSEIVFAPVSDVGLVDVPIFILGTYGIGSHYDGPQTR